MKKALTILYHYFKKLDKLLFIAGLISSALSVVLIYSIYKNGVSSSVYSSTYKTQIIAAALGVICAVILSLIDYNKLAKYWYVFAALGIGLVLLTFTPLGSVREGTAADDKAWLYFAGTSVQPSEFLKIAFILSFSYHVSKVHDKINKPLNLLLLGIHGAIPIGLVSLQGDQGTAIVFAVIFAFILFVGGISWKLIAAAALASPIMAVIAWNFILLDHHKERIMVIFNPDLDPLGAGLQQRQGKIALGSGQLFGKGLFGGDYSYVVEVQNDFIFSYIGQALGFIGCLAVCTVLAFILIKLIINAINAKDDLGKYICVGVFAMIFIHSFLNIGMVLCVMPVIGIPLPFLSAGGSSVLSMYLAIGLALSVYAHSERKNPIFY